VEQCALFAARKEYELLKLLASDKKAMAAARRLGFSRGAGQPLSHAGLPHATSRASRQEARDAQRVPPQGNAKQRRSWQRSAARHAARQRFIRSRFLATLFVIRLRRRARLRRAFRELDELRDESVSDEAADQAGHDTALSKRERASSPSSSSSGRTSESSAPIAKWVPLGAPWLPPSPTARGGGKAGRKGTIALRGIMRRR
jgi:hypothetical protein